MSKDGSEMEFSFRRIREKPLGPSLSDPEHEQRYQSVKHLEGLWWAPYGGHGNEILQVGPSACECRPPTVGLVAAGNGQGDIDITQSSL
eukprot:scaffold12089_cov40-Prasinocladus_malaysianus.AAC.1